MRKFFSDILFLKHIARKSFFSGIIIAVFCFSFLFFTPITYKSANNKVNSPINPSGSSIQGESNFTNNDWSMFHNSANHTGITETNPVKGNYTIWSRFFKNQFGTYRATSSPAIVNGKLYVGSANNNIVCLNATSGSLFWEYDTGNPVWTDPAVIDGMVFAVNEEGAYCLNATLGTLLWMYAGVLSTSPTVANGRVYVGSYKTSIFGGNVYCLNETSGTLLWSHSIKDWVESTPTVVNGRVYVGSYQTSFSGSNLYCLNATSGTVLWNFTTGGQISDTSPVVANERVYVEENQIFSVNGGVVHDNIYCLNATSGTFLWNYTTDSAYISSTPAVAYGKVFVGLMDGEIYCLNATSGVRLWMCTAIDGMFSDSPAVANGMIYLGSFWKNYTFCFNATSGIQIWNYTTDSPVMSSPAIANGMVYVQSYDGRLYCFPMLLTYHAPKKSIGGMNLIELSSMVVIGVMIVVKTVRTAKKRPE